MSPVIAATLWDWLGPQRTAAVRADHYLAPVFEALARGNWRALTEREAVRLTSCSRATLHRAAKRVFGVPYVKVALDFRLEMAGRLLRAAPETVAAVAHAVGYPDPVVFRQAFKRHFGESPAQYAPRRAQGGRPRLHP